MDDLPLDVLYYIVDTLVCSGDFDTLKLCSMVCQALRSMCVRHLFAKIKIADCDSFGRRYSLPVGKMKDILEQNPKLAKCVKHLEVRITPFEYENMNIPTILNHFQNVGTLLIDGYPHRYRDVSPEIPEPLRLSLEKIIGSPSLVDLQIISIDNALGIRSILAASASLKCLTLCDTNVSVNRMHPIIIPPHTPVLRLSSFTICVSHSLDIGTSLFALKQLDGQPVVDLASLTNLSLKIIQMDRPEEVEMMKAYLGVCMKLRTLWLQVIHDHTHGLDRVNFSDYIHTSSLNTLRHLKLDYTLLTDGDPYIGACDDLRRLASAGCPLESLRIKICLWSEYEYFVDPVVWNRLDVLSEFPALREVTLEVHLFEEHDYILPTHFSLVLKTAFNVLSSTSRFKFQFSVHDSTNIDRRKPAK